MAIIVDALRRATSRWPAVYTKWVHYLALGFFHSPATQPITRRTRTMPLRSWIPDNIPLDRPSAARMYDYALGGYHNFEIDRRAGDQVATIFPDLPLALRANRAFMRRAVTFLVEQGIDQFLDLGSGIPTVGNVHE